MEKSSQRPSVSAFPPTGWQLALDRAPMFLSVILLFILPFLTQLEGADPIHPKLALAQMLVFFILCAWVLKLLMTARMDWVQTTALRPLAALLIWVLITLPFSHFAGAGWIFLKGWICFPLWYFLLTLTCFESWKAENLLVVFLSAALGTCGWAAAQKLGVGERPWLEIARNQFNGRVTAGFGNPDFLAGYLLLVWPLAFALYLKAQRSVSRILWSGLLIFSLLSLFWTGSKAGFLGLVTGALVYAFCYYGRGNWGKSLRKILIIAATTIVLLSALSFFHSLNGPLDRLSQSKNESVWFRATVWKGVLEMIKVHPILGTGLGTFESAYPSYRPAALMMRESQRSYQVDHAHNWVLEWTAETGPVGLGLLLWLGWAVLAQWWRLFLANAISKTLGAGVFAAFAGVAVDNLFDVNSCLPTTLMPLLLLAALPVALSQRFYHLEGFPIRRQEVDLSRFKLWLWPAGLLIVSLAFAGVARAFQGQMANVILKRASAASEAGKWDQAIGLYGDVLRLDPDEISAYYFRGSTYFDRAGAGDMEMALSDLEKTGQISPDYVLIHFKKYEVLSRLNRQEEAKVELKRAVLLDPMLVFLLDDFKKARELVSAGRTTEAFVIYQNLFFDYPACVPMITAYANCFALTRDYSSAINLYRKALELDPGNEKVLYDLDAVRKVQAAVNQNQSLHNGILGSEIR